MSTAEGGTVPAATTSKSAVLQKLNKIMISFAVEPSLAAGIRELAPGMVMGSCWFCFLPSVAQEFLRFIAAGNADPKLPRRIELMLQICSSCREEYALAVARVLMSFRRSSVIDAEDLNPEDVSWYLERCRARLALLHTDATLWSIFPGRNSSSIQDTRIKLPDWQDICASVLSFILRRDSYQPLTLYKNPPSDPQHTGGSFTRVEDYVSVMHDSFRCSFASKAKTLLESGARKASRRGAEFPIFWLKGNADKSSVPVARASCLRGTEAHSHESQTAGTERESISRLLVVIQRGKARSGDVVSLRVNNRGKCRSESDRFTALFSSSSTPVREVLRDAPDGVERFISSTFRVDAGQSRNAVEEVEDDDDEPEDYNQVTMGRSWSTSKLSLRAMWLYMRTDELALLFPSNFSASAANDPISRQPSCTWVEMVKLGNILPELRIEMALWRVPLVFPYFPMDMKHIILYPKAFGKRLFYQGVGKASDAHFEVSRPGSSSVTEMDPLVDQLNDYWKLNESQKLVFEHVASPPNFTRMTFVQGPPGTGKTKLIVSVLHLLVKSHFENDRNAGDKRVLVCTQSQAALDNLLTRFADSTLTQTDSITSDMVKRTIKFTRVGKSRDQRAKRYETLSIAERERKSQMDVVRESSIVFATLSGAGGCILEYQRFTHLVVDEACTASEAELLIPLTRPACLKDPIQRAFLVGDPQQLPPFLDKDTTDTYPEAAHSLRRSLFQRIVDEAYNSEWFEEQRSRLTRTLGLGHQSLHSTCISHGLFLLQIQYRMHPIVSNYISVTFYKGLVRDGFIERDSFEEYRQLKPLDSPILPAREGLFGPLVFLDTSGVGSEGEEETREQSHSLQNKFEASVVAELIGTLSEDGNQRGRSSADGTMQENGKRVCTVVVISAYRGQVDLIRELLDSQARTQASCEGDGPRPEVLVETVNSMQGREADIVILSLVRTRCAVRKLGFLQEPQRLNVALSRAKESLLVVGNLSVTKQSPSVQWLDFIRCCEINGLVVSVPNRRPEQ